MKFFGKRYQNKVGINARKELHENSKELVEILNNHIDITGFNIYECGSGGCRNLYYIWKSNADVELYASDLHRDASMKNTHDDIKNIVTFFEGDSEDVINTIDFTNMDLILFSDHLMHLDYKKADAIIEKVAYEIKPTYIMLREVKEEFEFEGNKGMVQKLYHNYDKFLDNYDIMYDGTSKNSKHYFIKLLKLKGD